MARILVLGGAGEMGSVAVRDLVEHTDHEVVIADLRPDAAEALADELGSSSRVSTRTVDVEDDRSLREAMVGADTVLNATYMRWNVRVTRAAIEAGVHLVDKGAYVADTAEQLAMDEQAKEAGCRIVPGCGVTLLPLRCTAYARSKEEGGNPVLLLATSQRAAEQTQTLLKADDALTVLEDREQRRADRSQA